MSEKKNTIIYIIRHGPTSSNKQNIYAGWCDEGLHDEGIVQVREIGEKLKDLNLAIIYTSPIRRALQTADMLSYYLGVNVIIENDLKEMKLGPWEGMSEHEIVLKYPAEYEVWNMSPAALRIHGRETLQSVQNRAIRIVNKVANINKNGACLMVTHVSIIRCLLLFYNKWNLDIYRSVTVDNLALFKLDWDKGHISMIC